MPYLFWTPSVRVYRPVNAGAPGGVTQEENHEALYIIFSLYPPFAEVAHTFIERRRVQPPIYLVDLSQILQRTKHSLFTTVGYDVRKSPTSSDFTTKIRIHDSIVRKCRGLPTMYHRGDRPCVCVVSRILSVHSKYQAIFQTGENTSMTTHSSKSYQATAQSIGFTTIVYIWPSDEQRET